MTISRFHALACPLDGGPLQLERSSWQCGEGHSFDVARQGYVHLLPVQNKRSKDPGDNKEMVAARQRFLNSGYYQPIAKAVCQTVLESGLDLGEISCLDAGCGEGYYLRCLADTAPGALSLSLLGVDISKWAILSAAKQFKAPAWVVGSNANLPVLAESLDRILCLFGFPVYQEFARVLKSGGEVIQVDAGPEHLVELRQIIYPELKVPRQAKHAAPEGFEFMEASVVRYNLTLPDKNSILDLLAMTPHLYRASAEGIARANALESLTVTVEATVSRFKKS
ncbi:putative RNA methyltransferase [Marinobacter salexigens]|uniref:putative RNA methyltransferase n=1 Tax=Marinobacter salexigens TaxID=1925763 RepID=UPI000C28A58B|nr:methyltransferase domain-containing protein [Marinobacter salexigens]